MRELYFLGEALRLAADAIREWAQLIESEQAALKAAGAAYGRGPGGGAEFHFTLRTARA